MIKLDQSTILNIDLAIVRAQQLEVGDSHYAYKAYLLNLLNFGYEAKKTWLQSGFFYKDTHSEFDNKNIVSETKHLIKTEGTASKNINVSKINQVNFGYLK